MPLPRLRPLPVALSLALSGLALVASASEDADLARVESLAKKTRVSEERILDEIMGRMGRIESTTSDIRTLLEAMPDAGAPAARTAATPVPAAKPAVATCPKPPVATLPAPEDDATELPVALIAGGSSVLALLLGLLLGRRRHAATPLASAARKDAPDSVPLAAATTTRAVAAHNTTPVTDEPIWKPQQNSATEGGSREAVATTSAPASPSDTPSVAPPLTAAGKVNGITPKPLPAEVTARGGGEMFDPTLELAEIMMSMGMASGAAQALEEHIRANPREALVHWLKLLDVYRRDGHRTDFEKVARDLRQNFNIKATDWLNPKGRQPGLEDFTRVRDQVTALWAKPAECIDYLANLLEDNRDGMRNGFPQSVAEEILLLITMQKSMHPELATEPAAATVAAATPLVVSTATN